MGCCCWFQFLIGTVLHTEKVIDSTSHEDVFQFLIGTVLQKKKK